jgi:4-amino-4-deoxy-L-arabinose transferase-like glycosyltransferase
MGNETREPSLVAFLNRHYVAIAALVLGLAAFNLTFRLGSETVAQWDESLYAISAWEMVDGANWVVTTFHRSVDYYNTKPPLNVWLIALSFKAFGRDLVSLRLASVAAAWLTIAVLMWWSRLCFGRAVSLASGLVLATTFAFLHVHAARSANTDALFTLLVVLTAVVLWGARDRPWRLAWLGPIVAAAFLLRGMGMLMPVAIALAAGLLRQRRKPVPWFPVGLAVLLFLMPVTAWIVARWRADEWMFLDRLFFYDFVSRTFRVIEQHPGSPFFYVAVLMRHQYDWVLAALASCLLFPVSRPQVRRMAMLWRDRDDLTVLMAGWAGMTLLIPTVMATKVPWYLNTF